MFALPIAMDPVAAHAAAGSATVRVNHIDFRPHVLRIDKGTRVTWKFQEEYTPHNVTSRGKLRFKSSGNREYGDTYAVTFRKKGTYQYHCTIHPNMDAKIVVK